jgi:hypothetical protein
MASCSRKLFRALAAEFKEEKPEPNDPARDVWHNMVVGTARVLKADNANFRADLFYAACGMDG